MVTFNFSYAPGTSLQQMTGFETAGRIWSSYLTDNVTVNLHVGVSSSLPSNVIGGALPGIRANQDYQSIKAKLATDATSADDNAAIANLNKRGTVLESFFDLFNASGNNVGTLEDTSTLSLTRANAKAMGVSLSDGNTLLDGVIMFGSLAGSAYSWNYDYTRSTAPAVNSLDFLSTAIHEIGHVLGMTSSVDKTGWLNSSVGGIGSTESLAYQAFAATSITYTTALDLFRYSPQTLGTIKNDLSYGSNGGAKYFSIDGNTIVSQFSTGKDTSLGGDGQQASHWKQGVTGIMDPTLALGARESITALDLRAMDVIGWNLASNATTLNLNLSALVGASQTALATRIGQTVTWMNANATTAAATIDQDRSLDISAMMISSQVYEWGTTILNPYRQVIDVMSQQKVYTSFQTTTSMCACTLCQQSPKADMAAAIASPDSKAVGWLGAPPASSSQPSSQSLQVDHRIGQLVQTLIRYQAAFESQSQTALPSTTPSTAKFVTFAGTNLAETAPQPSTFQSGQTLQSQTQPYFYGSSARRSEALSQSSDPPPSFELSFDTLASLKLS